MKLISAALMGVVLFSSSAFAGPLAQFRSICEKDLKLQYAIHFNDQMGGNCSASTVAYSSVQSANIWVREPGYSVPSIDARGTITLSCNGRAFVRPFRMMLQQGAVCELGDATPWSTY